MVRVDDHRLDVHRAQIHLLRLHGQRLLGRADAVILYRGSLQLASVYDCRPCALWRVQRRRGACDAPNSAARLCLAKGASSPSSCAAVNRVVNVGTAAEVAVFGPTAAAVIVLVLLH